MIKSNNILATVAMIAMAALMCTGCTSEDYLGNPEDLSRDVAISFGGETGKMTRATGSEAAGLLGNQFVVYGFKTRTDGVQTVYDHYNVKYTDGSAHTTTSNTAGWEYVNQAPNVLNENLSGTPGMTQDIKYWDFAANKYDFIAFSTGTATQVKTPGEVSPGKVCFSPVDKAHLTDAAYTITGAVDDLTKVYIADRITAVPTGATAPSQVNYKAPIQFTFKPLAAKVRIGLYETIPGYSVKDVKFYLADDNYNSTLTTTPHLFAGSDAMPSGTGTVAMKFDDTADQSSNNYNKVKVASYTGDVAQDIALQTIVSSSYAGKENLEGGKDANPGNVFLGRSSNEATTSGYQSVVPTGTGNSLTLKMDYTLLSTDISKETITVRGATAIIPAEFCNWLPNHAYTYLFKISDNTSGWTNPHDAGHVGLYPVTLDAIVAATEEGMQQTITLMDAPSITTYAKGERIHEDGTKLNYYEKGDYNIYICLQPSTLTLNSSNTKMYKATTTGPAAIVEATVADVIKTGTQAPVGTYTKDDVTVTTITAPSIVTSIPAGDAPYGTAIPGNFAVFQPTTAGTYVFEYTSPPEHYTYDEYKALTGNESVTEQEFNALSEAAKLKPNKHYKVIVVKQKP